MVADAPFWSDDFDMDLPKVIPDARELLGDLAELEMWTTGHPDKVRCNLNHPDVWNGDHTMIAYFGLRIGSPYRPSQCVSSGVQVRCTAWEAFRDAWPHHYLIILDRNYPIWDTFRLQEDFNIIMCDLRGWRPNHERATAARERVSRSIMAAVQRLRLVPRHT